MQLQAGARGVISVRTKAPTAESPSWRCWASSPAFLITIRLITWNIISTLAIWMHERTVEARSPCCRSSRRQKRRGRKRKKKIGTRERRSPGGLDYVVEYFFAEAWVDNESHADGQRTEKQQRTQRFISERKFKRLIHWRNNSFPQRGVSLFIVLFYVLFSSYILYDHSFHPMAKSARLP